jgi:hypothetical protein
MNSKVIHFGTVLLARNHVIFLILSIILVSSAVASSQMADAKNTTASTSPFTATQRVPTKASIANQRRKKASTSLSPIAPIVVLVM